jgi:hypothetical protein
MRRQLELEAQAVGRHLAGLVDGQDRRPTEGGPLVAQGEPPVGQVGLVVAVLGTVLIDFEQVGEVGGHLQLQGDRAAVGAVVLHDEVLMQPVCDHPVAADRHRRVVTHPASARVPNTRAE